MGQSSEVVALLEEIDRGKKLYNSLKGKAVKRERRSVKQKVNSLVKKFNANLGYKVVTPIQ